MSKKHAVLNSFQDMSLHSRNPNTSFMIGEAPSLRAGVVAVTDVEMENLMTVGDGVVVAIGIVIEIEGKELHFHACMDKSQVP